LRGSVAGKTPDTGGWEGVGNGENEPDGVGIVLRVETVVGVSADEESTEVNEVTAEEVVEKVLESETDTELVTSVLVSKEMDNELCNEADEEVLAVAAIA